MPSQTAKRSLAAKISRVCRYGLCAAIFSVLALVVLQAVAVESFHIPSGSMAPALQGHHRVGICPRCGQAVAVGRNPADRDGTGQSRYYRKAFCPNCGLYPVPIADQPEIPGDQIQVNKSAFLVRSPSRWEIVVFRLFGTFYIKRLLGLPNETIRVHDGDVYVNGRLLRKTFAEAKGMRVLVFDQANAPKVGWKDRWELRGPLPPGEGATKLLLDGRASPATLTYRNFVLESGKCEPMRDEYAYNGGLHADSECVHDFLIETDVVASPGRGSIALRLCDGHDWIDFTLPIGLKRPVRAVAWPIDSPDQARALVESEKPVALKPGQRYRVELALVDRRFTLAVNEQIWLDGDLPEAKKRQGVERPFQAFADGVQVALPQFRLYRDVHYGQQGVNAVRGKSVRLGPDQYFMMGDNSPNSEDSRFWRDDGRIDAECLIGPVMRVRRN